MFSQYLCWFLHLTSLEQNEELGIFNIKLVKIKTFWNILSNSLQLCNCRVAGFPIWKCVVLLLYKRQNYVVAALCIFSPLFLFFFFKKYGEVRHLFLTYSWCTCTLVFLQLWLQLLSSNWEEQIKLENPWIFTFSRANT